MNRKNAVYRAFFNATRGVCAAADVAGIGVFKAYDGVMFVGDRIVNLSKSAAAGMRDGASLRHAPPAITLEEN